MCGVASSSANTLTTVADTVDHHAGIDPFSTKYWEPEPKPAAQERKAAIEAFAGAKGSKQLAHASSNNAADPTAASAMAPPPAPADAFAALSSAAGNSGSKADAKKSAVVPADMADDFKRGVLEYPTLSRIGLIELLCAKFPQCTKAQVRNSLDLVAEQAGSGRAKAWKLKPGFEV